MKSFSFSWCWRIVGFAIGVALWLALPAAAAHAEPGALDSPISAQWAVQPTAVFPGEPLTYTLTLQNSGEADHRVTISANLPSGFELALPALPVGASYSLRSADLHWAGDVAAHSTYTLAFSGLAPLEPRSDGRLAAYVALDDGFQLVHLSATGWAGTLPAAAFTHTVGLDPAPTIQFTDLSQGVGPLSTWWEFGDGATSAEQNPIHTYAAGGQYTVRLTTANPRGADSVARTLVVSSPTPEPSSGHDILVSDDTPAVGQPVYFRSSETVSVTLFWDFGDGVTANGASPMHVYQQPGLYTVTRLLGEGAASFQSSSLLAVDYPPLASIQVAQPHVSVGELVAFTALTSAPEMMSYYWDFGDGNSASHGSVAHSYGAPGVYSVTLAVSNAYGVALDTLALRISPRQLYLPLVTNGAQWSEESPPESEPDEEATTAVETSEPEPDIALPADPLAQEVLQAINAERQTAGLSPLTWSDQLVRSAQHHSDDMATQWFTGHIGSNGSHPIDRFRQASYTGDYAGECTAWGFDEIASAVAWLMTSPPHRVIILSTVATEIGGAYSYNPDAPSVHYWTIDFGSSQAP
jgi:uncharacterized repeat protein (TIGR01451 family)